MSTRSKLLWELERRKRQNKEGRQFIEEAISGGSRGRQNAEKIEANRVAAMRAELQLLREQLKGQQSGQPDDKKEPDGESDEEARNSSKESEKGQKKRGGKRQAERDAIYWKTEFKKLQRTMQESVTAGNTRGEAAIHPGGRDVSMRHFRGRGQMPSGRGGRGQFHSQGLQRRGQFYDGGRGGGARGRGPREDYQFELSHIIPQELRNYRIFPDRFVGTYREISDNFEVQVVFGGLFFAECLMTDPTIENRLQVIDR
ncbi:uncharacterized protein LOC135169353 [Diachasmimorpha longicaudata]|uniref:uncharacterized protein LOC135169353 n=1 Tax=Diachasmimorpha longicaudata TaxID=58733 RepID=UPI0030B8900B